MQHVVQGMRYQLFASCEMVSISSKNCTADAFDVMENDT